MSADPASVPTTNKPAEPARLDALIQKVLPFATMADAFARRTVGKVRTLAMLGLLASGWIAYACTDTFDLGLATLLIMFAVIALPAAILWKVHGVLADTIGLPQRIRDTAMRAVGKAEEYRQQFATKHPLDPSAQKPRLKHLVRAGKVMFEVKALGDEAQDLVSASAGAMVLANPMFLIVFAVTMGLVFVLIGIAAIVALAYVV